MPSPEDRDLEIAELRARLQRLEGAPIAAPAAVTAGGGASPATGFSRGFFGFFGVLAAIAALAIAGLVGLVSCANLMNAAPSTSARADTPITLGGNVDSRTASIPLTPRKPRRP